LNLSNTEWDFYCDNFSFPRMEKFREISMGIEPSACQLHDYNSLLSSALWELISAVELSLRNTIARQLSLNTFKSVGDEKWLTSKDSPLRIQSERVAKELDDAMFRIQKTGKPISESRVIAELSLGFWASLVSKRFVFLWPDLLPGFRGAKTRNQRVVAEHIDKLRILRNKIGHHHSIVQLDLHTELQSIFELAEMLDPQFRKWLQHRDRVSALIAELTSQTTQE